MGKSKLFCVEVIIKGKGYIKAFDVITREPVIMVRDTPEWREVLQDRYNCDLPIEEGRLILSPLSGRSRKG